VNETEAKEHLQQGLDNQMQNNLQRDERYRLRNRCPSVSGVEAIRLPATKNWPQLGLV
jgi:hypothetical protein